MKKAIIIYQSKKGTTKYFGEKIQEFLNTNNVDTETVSIYDAKPELIKNADYVLLGCWTDGLMIFLQHPDKPWLEFAQSLPEFKDKKVGLFTTYKVATGSMFRRMEKSLKNKISAVDITLKSKSEKLQIAHKEELLRFIY